MATNKNQHFVPRCYLRPFTIGSGNLAINLFNIDRLKFIEKAPVKHQCSGDYFYGDNPHLEKGLQLFESNYGRCLRNILQPGYKIKKSDHIFFLRFWLLQHMRTEAASKRAIEMSDGISEIVFDKEAHKFRLGIREAVQHSMQNFAEQRDLVDDLEIRFFRNRTSIPFITSDDPAILTNRWYLNDKRTAIKSFGLGNSGNILLLPLTPKVLFMGYDSDVYSVAHKGNKWVDVRNEVDIESFNQHQFFNCWANIYVQDSSYAQGIHDTFLKVESLRPQEKHRFNYAILDSIDGNHKRYRSVDRDLIGDHQEVLIHSQTIHPRPDLWPRQLSWKRNGKVFTNGSGVGYIRKATIERTNRQGFRGEPARKRHR